MKYKNEQENFWAEQYSDSYIKKNSSFDVDLGSEGWSKILKNTDLKIKNFLEFGCNVGRNIDQLKSVIPDSKPSMVEISKEAYDIACSKFNFEHSLMGLYWTAHLKKNILI